MNDASKRSSARLSRWQDRSRREGCRKQPGYRTDRDGRFEVPLEYLTANDLIRFLMERKQIEKPISVVKEFAFPPQVGVSDFNVWDEVEPPGGTFLITRYDRSTIPSPVRPAGYAAAPAIAVQGFNRAMNPTMRAKLHNGLTIKHATRRATRELEEFDH